MGSAENAAIYFNVAFVVVLVSLLVQGSTIRPAAVRLGLAVRAKSKRPRRVELDLPGQLSLEMVGYHVVESSAILGGAELPAKARLVLVVREQEIIEAARAGALKPDDYAYFLASPDQIHALDALFASREDAG